MPSLHAKLMTKDQDFSFQRRVRDSASAGLGFRQGHPNCGGAVDEATRKPPAHATEWATIDSNPAPSILEALRRAAAAVQHRWCAKSGAVCVQILDAFQAAKR
jgi:hypothetical protein